MGHRRTGDRARPGYRAAVAAGALTLCVLAGVSCSPGERDTPATRTEAGAKAEAAAAASARPAGCRRTLVGVAHPDDDLYFIDPEIRATIRAGCPVTTVYLTAGDGGKRPRRVALDYVEKREQGVRAAYAALAGAPDRWTEGTVRVDGRAIRSFTLDRSSGPTVRLVFLGLHDGLPKGQGEESMLKLFRGTRERIPLFGSRETFTGEQLVRTLSDLARQDKAQRILTLDHDNASFAYGLSGRVDHSDHGIGARYFRRAGYVAGIPVSAYLGYTMSSLRANLPEAQVPPKETAVRRYIAGAECRYRSSCATEGVYKGHLPPDSAKWIHRQYGQTHRAPRPGEIMADIGRTTAFSGRSPEQCLEAVSAEAKDGAVRINGCDGTRAQRWDIRSDGTIRSLLHENHCLTELSKGAGLARCSPSHAEQRWTHRPWKSATWKRAAWRIAGNGNKCLYQDDRPLPPRWEARTEQHPRLGLIGCDEQIQPGLYWTRHGAPRPAPSGG
ncbi:MULTISPECIES: ricin-type beta-trefoil lectin domain protein [unclassified Streptomyces]|uniref:ricin-type beta-trefoil lectin domain protein n=1 Tax=unclassified Streptomyces TaxID=2593676 RepID=UPI002E28B252|nr:ricin-type beta-trefoil lectin domain protein [Streptomyces sp. NBC_01429]